MSIKIFKLTNTEEIIAECKKEDGKIFLEKPARIALMPTQDHNGIAMALIPWTPYSKDEKIEIYLIHIIAEVDPTDEIANEYRERFGSGLFVPPSDSIIA